MRKIISMLLVLTMVVTTLMSVMVIDVSAVSSTDFATSVTVTPATDTAPRKIEYTFGVPTVPAKSPNPTVNSAFRYATGEWYATGYTYDGKLSTTVTSLDATGKYDAVNFADVSVISNPLDKTNNGEMSKVSFKPVTIKDDTRTANNAAVSANYLRFMLMGADLDANFDMSTVTNWWNQFSVNESFSDLKTADLRDKALTNGGAYVYTFYAYTNKNAQANSVTFLARDKDSGAGEIALPEQYIYSESALNDGTKGVPHKVQFVVSGSDLANVYFHIYVDGVEMGSGLKATRTLSKTPFKLVLNQNIALTGASFGIKEADWYVSKAPTGLIAPVLMTADELKNELIVVPNMTAITQASTYRTDDYITGVNADVDSGIKAALESTAIGDNRVEIYESVYNDVTKVVDTTVSNPTVKLVNRTTGAEVEYADATGSMDNYYFMVNGVYVIPVKVADPLPYAVGAGKPFTVGTHNSVTTRTRHENFIDNVNTGDSFGGLQNGFYRFTNEPRSGMAFSNGGSMYNTNGYVGMRLYTNGTEIKNTSESSYLSKYDVEKNIVTAEFDAYFPEYASGGFYAGWSLYDNGSRINQNSIKFNSSNIASGSGDVIDVEGNAWNKIALAFDMTDTVNDGVVDVKVYVNGVYQKTINSINVDLKDEAAVQFAPIGFLRFYSPAYVSYATMGAGKWYVGDYTPSAPVVSDKVITAPAESVYVSEADLLIASQLTDAELIALMSDYVPVYKNTYNIDVINAKYDEVDGTVTSLKGTEDFPTGAYSAFKGEIIKRWIESTDNTRFTVTAGENGQLNTYTYTTSDVGQYIISATDNGDETATIAFSGTSNASFTDSNSYSGVCTGLPEIIALAEGGVTKELVGFAVVDEGKFPKVYTLAESGLNLRALTFNTATNNAELYYTKFGAVDGNGYTFQLIVGAYNENGKLLALKSSVSSTLNNETENGSDTITFAPEFDEKTLSETKYYKVFMFNSLKEAVAIMPVAKVVK